MNPTKVALPALFTLGLLAFETSASAQGAPAPALPAGSAAPEASAPPPVEDDRGPVRTDGDQAPPARPKARGKAMAEADEEPNPPARPAYILPAVEAPREEPAPAKPPPQPRIQHWSAGFGFTGSAVNSPGFDPYSKSNTLPMISVFGTYTPWVTRPVSVHLGLQYDYGGAGEKARGANASLDIHRLALGLEGRYVPVSRMMLFVRAMPAAVHLGGTIQDPYLNTTLESGSWIFSADVTGGAAARIGSIGHAELPAVSFWVALDMGYRFAPSASMRFRPGNLTADDEGRRFGEVTLPNLDLSGFIGKLSVSVSF